MAFSKRPGFAPLDERHAMKVYNDIMKRIVVPQVGNKSTFLTELDKAGLKLLGGKFKGTYSSDQIPRLNELKKYCILNLDRSDQPGSHWIACAFKDEKIYVYDSFGRKNTKIIPALKAKYHELYNVKGRPPPNGKFGRGANVVFDSDRDAEQKIHETNCGARSLSWLLMVEHFGLKNALKI